MLSPEEQNVLEKYYKENYANMLRLARSCLHSENLAEVAVQDTFVTASEKFPQFTGSQNPVGWLYLTLKNVIREVKREWNKTIARFVALDSIQEPAEEMPDIHSLDLIGNADLRLMAKYYLYGCTLEELAAEMDISVPAVKMRITRARKRLQEDPQIKNFQ